MKHAAEPPPRIRTASGGNAVIISSLTPMAVPYALALPLADDIADAVLLAYVLFHLACPIPPRRSRPRSQGS